MLRWITSSHAVHAAGPLDGHHVVRAVQVVVHLAGEDHGAVLQRQQLVFRAQPQDPLAVTPPGGRVDQRQRRHKLKQAVDDVAFVVCVHGARWHGRGREHLARQA